MKTVLEMAVPLLMSRATGQITSARRLRAIIPEPYQAPNPDAYHPLAADLDLGGIMQRANLLRQWSGGRL